MSLHTAAEHQATGPVLHYLHWRSQHPNRGVPAHHVTTDGFHLGIWVRRTRAAYWAGTLPLQRASELDAIGFTWTADADRHLGRQSRSNQRWQELLDDLDIYRADHGDVLVPTNYTAPSGNRLGEWLSRQQRQWRHGQLPDARVDELHSRGVRASREDTMCTAVNASPILATHDPTRRPTLTEIR